MVEPRGASMEQVCHCTPLYGDERRGAPSVRVFSTWRGLWHTAPSQLRARVVPRGNNVAIRPHSNNETWTRGECDRRAPVSRCLGTCEQATQRARGERLGVCLFANPKMLIHSVTSRRVAETFHRDP